MTDANAGRSTTALSGVVSGPELEAASIPPLTWAVPGILPEGLGILAARPKAGKSCLVLGIGLSVAAGKPVLGVPVEKRPVLYLALEDGWRRIDDRCRNILGDGESYPAGISFTIEPHDALKLAQNFVKENPGALVILDTLAVVKPGRRAGDDLYGTDYAFTRLLKSIAEPGATVLVVHHTRKAEAENFLDTVSGTYGIAGAADFVMVLNRKEHDRKGVLQITGRDVEEASYSLIFDGGKWLADGNCLDEAAQRANQAQLGHTKRLVLQFVNSRPMTRAADVVSSLGITSDSARQTLTRLASEGLIVRYGAGVYIPVTSSHSPNTPSSERSRTCDTPSSFGHAVTREADTVTPDHDTSRPLSRRESSNDEGDLPIRDTVTEESDILRDWRIQNDRNLEELREEVTKASP
ncbi:AAA family ATPase [Mycolicibacterium elephantis]|uniref:AAA family ATPase n=1 Tax=Mycolicibacterium elephantis TaxID=81858 RepID=UPI003A876D17